MSPICYDISGRTTDELTLLETSNLLIGGTVIDEGSYHHHAIRLESVRITAQNLLIEIDQQGVAIYTPRRRYLLPYHVDSSVDIGWVSIEIYSKATHRLPGGQVRIGKDLFNFSIKEQKNSLKFRLLHLEDKTGVSGVLSFAMFSRYKMVNDQLLQIGQKEYDTKWDEKELCHRLINPPSPKLIQPERSK